jgi:hypothetical protein
MGCRSVESGLLTLVLRGKDSVYGSQGASGFALEIEDLISLHIVGDNTYSAVVAALSAGNCFQASASESSLVISHCVCCTPFCKWVCRKVKEEIRKGRCL